MASKLYNRGYRPMVMEAGVECRWYPGGFWRFWVTAKAITVANTTGVSFGGVKLWTYPAAHIYVENVHLVSLSVGLGNAGNATPIAGTMGGDFAIGSTAPSDGTLSAADVNHLASTSIDPISGGLSNIRTASDTELDGTSTPIPVYANMLIDDADVADAASDVLELTATIDVVWRDRGGAGS